VLQWASVLAAAGFSRTDESLTDPLVAANVLLLGPVTLGAAFALAHVLAGRLLGLWLLVTWLATPWLAYLFALPGYRDEIRDTVLPLVLGLAPERGFAAGAAVLVAAALSTVPARWAAAAAGACLGAAVLLVPATVAFVVAAPLALVLARRLTAAATVVVAATPFVLAAALARGVEVDARSVAAFKASMGGLREYFFSQRLLQWLPLAGAVGVARRSPALAVFLGGGFLAFALLQTARTDAEVATTSFFRLLLPGLPVLGVLLAALPLLVPSVATRLGGEARPLLR
jgi:hypothetical protein